MRSRRPAQRLGQSAAGQYEDPRQPGVPVAGEEHGLSLPLQGSQGDLRAPHPLCSCQSGVNAPQIHIRRHDERGAPETWRPGRVRPPAAGRIVISARPG